MEYHSVVNYIIPQMVVNVNDFKDNIQHSMFLVFLLRRCRDT